jgi:hypothetical protein
MLQVTFYRPAPLELVEAGLQDTGYQVQVTGLPTMPDDGSSTIRLGIIAKFEVRPLKY